MRKMNLPRVSASLCLKDIERLLERSKPEDGEILVGVLNACLSGISEDDCRNYDDCCRRKYLDRVFRLLWDGASTILPTTRKGSDVITAAGNEIMKQIEEVMKRIDYCKFTINTDEEVRKEIASTVESTLRNNRLDFFLVVGGGITSYSNFGGDIDVENCIKSHSKFHTNDDMETWRDFYNKISVIDRDAVGYCKCGYGDLGYYYLHIYETRTQVNMCVNGKDEPGDAIAAFLFETVSEPGLATEVYSVKLVNVTPNGVADYEKGVTVDIDEDIRKTLGGYINVSKIFGRDKAVKLLKIFDSMDI